jgi:hypothetical protein
MEQQKPNDSSKVHELLVGLAKERAARAEKVLEDYAQAQESKDAEATSTQAGSLLEVFAKEEWLSMSGWQQRWEALKRFAGLCISLAVLAGAVWYFRDSDWFWTVAVGATFLGGGGIIAYVREIYQHSRWLREERDELRRALKLPPRHDITDLEIR